MKSVYALVPCLHRAVTRAAPLDAGMNPVARAASRFDASVTSLEYAGER